MSTTILNEELEQPQITEIETDTEVETTFEDLNLSEDVLKAIQKMGYKSPSPIQAASIPVLQQNKDIIGQAQTGTGKTAAFSLPMIEKVDASSKDIQAVVICPTRELVLQVAENCKNMGQFKQGLKVVSIYGGQDVMVQKQALRRHPQILIATPGRLLDFLMRGIVVLHSVKTVVLDEADEMLNMGFIEDIDMILGCMNAEDRQTIFFSATMPKPILELTKKYQQNPEIVKVAYVQQESPNIVQTYVGLKGRQKPLALTKIIEQKAIKLGLVFCNTKRQVDFLSEHLRQEGIKAEGLHGGKAQNQRERILGRFRKGITQILIATDVAARGIDVKNVQAVINFDLPEDMDNYTHRIGRTGRAGQTGEAISMVADRDIGQFYELQKSQKNQIQSFVVEGVELVEIPEWANRSFEHKKAPSSRGRRRPTGGGSRGPRSFGSNRSERSGSGPSRSSNSSARPYREKRTASAEAGQPSTGGYKDARKRSEPGSSSASGSKEFRGEGRPYREKRSASAGGTKSSSGGYKDARKRSESGTSSSLGSKEFRGEGRPYREKRSASAGGVKSSSGGYKDARKRSESGSSSASGSKEFRGEGYGKRVESGSSSQGPKKKYSDSKKSSEFKSKFKSRAANKPYGERSASSSGTSTGARKSAGGYKKPYAKKAAKPQTV